MRSKNRISRKMMAVLAAVLIAAMLLTGCGGGGGGSAASSVAPAPTPGPVSYTHLDVYKRQVVDAAKKADIPVTICGLAVGNAVNATQYLRLGLRSFSMSPQNLLAIKKALRDAETR